MQLCLCAIFTLFSLEKWLTAISGREGNQCCACVLLAGVCAGKTLYSLWCDTPMQGEADTVLWDLLKIHPPHPSFPLGN